MSGLNIKLYFSFWLLKARDECWFPWDTKSTKGEFTSPKLRLALVIAPPLDLDWQCGGLDILFSEPTIKYYHHAQEREHPWGVRKHYQSHSHNCDGRLLLKFTDTFAKLLHHSEDIFIYKNNYFLSRKQIPLMCVKPTMLGNYCWQCCQ